VILREEDVGGRERVTTDEERVARGGYYSTTITVCNAHNKQKL